MFFSNLFNSVKSRLGTKSILISVLLISAISIILSVFFVSRQKTLLLDKLHKRALSLSNTLVFNSQFPLIAQDEENLLNLLEGVKREDDITDAFFSRFGELGKTIIFHSDTTRVGEVVTFPAEVDFDTALRGDWFPAGESDKMRIVTPVFGFLAASSESDEFLFPSPEKEDSRDIFYGKCWFPCFTADSKEITFSHNRGIGNHSILSLNIETRAFRHFLKSATNGWWSHDGRYFVFVRWEIDTSVMETSVLDTLTKEIRIIQKLPYWPQPHFSFDDKYILSIKNFGNGGYRIVRIPFEGGDPEQITFHEGDHHVPESSPYGKWIIYTEFISNTIYAYNTETEETSRVFPDLQIPHNAGTFSPEGKKICYLRSVNDVLELFIADFPYIEGSGNYGTQLTFTEKNMIFKPDWSPDGRWITYTEDGDIFIISPEGGAPINLTRRTSILGLAVLDVSLENLNRELAAAILYAVGITLIIIIAGALGAVLLVRTITVPIHKLAEASEAVGKLDFDQKVSVDRTDELGVLAGSFNKMTQRLKASRDEIDDMNRSLDAKVQKRTA